jgi:predicted Zn-dependent protease with MMP-like domain
MATTIGPDVASTYITASQLEILVEAAKGYWQAFGLTSEQRDLLDQVVIQVDDLDGAILGQTQGVTVTIDSNAAGHGWFVDSTPQDNSEFQFVRSLGNWIANPDSEASHHIDLLTTVMHELGHILGLDDRQATGRHNDVMSETLPDGVRRLPTLNSLFGTGSVVEQKPALGQGRPLFSSAFAGIQLERNVPLGNHTGNLTDFDDGEMPYDPPALASTTKSSWLRNFLFGSVRQNEQAAHDRFEVSLPPKSSNSVV